MFKSRCSKKISLLLVFISFFNVVLVFGQDDGEAPDPFDDTPPDFVPPAPIDDYVFVFALVAIVLAFYFFYLRRMPNQS